MESFKIDNRNSNLPIVRMVTLKMWTPDGGSCVYRTYIYIQLIGWVWVAEILILWWNSRWSACSCPIQNSACNVLQKCKYKLLVETSICHKVFPRKDFFCFSKIVNRPSYTWLKQKEVKEMKKLNTPGFPDKTGLSNICFSIRLFRLTWSSLSLIAVGANIFHVVSLMGHCYTIV